MTWSLSAMITALVRLPYVASINILRSLPSWIIRFIGADSGLTIEMMRFADTILPKPILINFTFNRNPHSLHIGYSMFCTCSFSFSSVAFTSMTKLGMAVPFTLEPIVFASRFISCKIKSNLRPIGPASPMTCSNCSA